MRILLLSIITILALALVPVPALAQVDKVCEETTANGEVPEFCTEQGSTNPFIGDGGILTTTINIITIIAGVSAVIVIIVSGFQFAVGGGDSGQVTKARQNLIYALAGLVIVVLARTIVIFVLGSI